MSLPEPLPWHDAAWRALGAAIDAGRVHHATLIEGAPGLGKQRFAERAAAALLCESPAAGAARPCGTCRSCLLVRAGSHPDRLQLTPAEDRRVIDVEQVRERIGELALTAHYASRRVVVVSPAEALGRFAANTLLKTLEEPPGGAVFLLVTARPGSLPATIRSRCSRLAFRAPPRAQGCRWLEREGGLDAERAAALIEWSAGAPLAALEAEASGAMASCQQLAGELAALLEGRLEVVAAAAAWRGHGLAQVVQWQLRIVAQAMRIKVLREERAAGRAMQAICGRLDLARLQRVGDELLELASALERQLHPADLLALEGLAASWRDAAAQARGRA